MRRATINNVGEIDGLATAGWTPFSRSSRQMQEQVTPAAG
jgi:hypothetical protein